MRYSSAPFAVILLLSLISPTRSECVSRPNVLMIIADDLNDWVGCLDGHPDARTPNIDRLAKRGLLFTNAHCAAPVCNPSRVATFTGRRPSSTGIYDNAPVWHEMLPGIASIPQHFKDHLHKMTLWARSTRLPLIFVAPGVTQEGTRTSRPVSFIDLFPTLNELCDLPQPAMLEGASLVSLLKDPNRTWERPALVTYLPGNHALCDERWRYIRYADGSEELYDHDNDPNEWTNLADKPDFASMTTELASSLPQESV